MQLEGVTTHQATVRTKWMVYNFDNAAEHTEHVLAFVSEVHFDDTFTFDDCWDALGNEGLNNLRASSGTI